MCHAYLNVMIDWKSEVEAIAEGRVKVQRYVA